ncbi:MAG TPA: OmpA family protein [Woeseiaceae bacterium]|nr:OmpA family protein [Woeseiaceae bacterium]
MRNPLISVAVTIGVAACLAAGPALAGGKASKAETAGVGAGAAVGALAGGPVGFVIGAAIGAKIGDEFHQKNAEVDSLTGSLRASRARVAELETDVDTLNADIDALGDDLRRMRAVGRPELVNLLASGIEMDLLFRTDEHVLMPSTASRLSELATTLAAMPDVRVRIDGYADERGAEDYNRELSVRRAEYVRNLLAAGGMPGSRIQVSGHGESPAQEATADDYALQRKVSLTLYVDDSPSLASNPN